MTAQSNDLTKLDLFIKIMKMTSADNPNQVLVAIGKANEMLKTEGWDWDRLLRAKIKVIQAPSFGSAGIAPQAKKATTKAYSPPPPPPPPKPAPNVWPGGVKPQPKVRPNIFNSGNTPPPKPQPSAPRVAPAGPPQFRRAANGTDWLISNPTSLTPGTIVNIAKADGSSKFETVGPFVEQNKHGYYLYEIAKAGKWKKRTAGGPSTVNDLLDF
jgi:hypothetical protein